MVQTQSPARSRKRFRWAVAGVVLLSWAAPAIAQSFGFPLLKSKVTLHRKLPALVHLPGPGVSIVVTARPELRELTHDFRSMLDAELLKDAPSLRINDHGAESLISCQITAFEEPRATSGLHRGTPSGAEDASYTRIKGMMRVSFQAHTPNGNTIDSDNIVARYEEEFDDDAESRNGGIAGIFKNGWRRLSGTANTEDAAPPTQAEAHAKLLMIAVQQIAEQVVDTRETIIVLLAKGQGMERGVRYAETGQWNQALEAWELKPSAPLARPVDDAYRLYDMGVADEALAYAASDVKTTVKLLSEAAINYSKAIDNNPGESYFLAPKKRIEAALAHFERLQQQAR